MESSATTGFPDEQTNPDAQASLCAEVVRHCEDFAQAMRNYKRPADVIAGADALVAFAKGGTR